MKYFKIGNISKSDYFNEKLEPGQDITFTLTGVSQRHYNYLRVLLSVAGSSSGSPFQAPPGTVRGNLINKTNPNICLQKRPIIWGWYLI